MCCDEGHIFCRACIIEYMVKQKRKIQEQNEQVEAAELKRTEKEELQKL